METERRVRNAKLFDNLAGGEASVSALDNQSEDIQAGLLSQREKGDDGVLIVHISNYMEIL